MTEEPDRQQAAGEDMTKKDAEEEMTTARVSFAMQACTINCSVAGSVCRALHTARHRGLLVLSCCGSYEVDAEYSELYQVIDHVSVITDEDTDLMVDEFIAAETRAWQEHLDAAGAAVATARTIACPSPKRSPTRVTVSYIVILLAL